MLQSPCQVEREIVVLFYFIIVIAVVIIVFLLTAASECLGKKRGSRAAKYL
jgi:hypothetical protein